VSADSLLCAVYLGLGTNLAPERHLRAAVLALAEWGEVRAVSPVYRTTPVGYADQPDYLNAALLLATALSPVAIWDTMIPRIEASLGRKRSENRNAPRTIDIDLLLYGDLVTTVGRHELPNPDLLTRSFSAVPVADLSPSLRHPVTGQTMAEIADRLRTGAPLTRLNWSLADFLDNETLHR
jgi:2-amino-4-hydroxy-6-hydroxymethyldihydropteridine diphosphokinase